MGSKFAAVLFFLSRRVEVLFRIDVPFVAPAGNMKTGGPPPPRKTAGSPLKRVADWK